MKLGDLINHLRDIEDDRGVELDVRVTSDVLGPDMRDHRIRDVAIVQDSADAPARVVIQAD